MSRTIWKFPVLGWECGVALVEMPKGARILHVHDQDGVPCVWADVDPSAHKVKRLLGVAGTGWDSTDLLMGDRPYLGTVHCGAYVWHLFDGGEA